MSVAVKLLVFSGRQNPVWELTPSQIADFKRRLNAITVTSLVKPPGMRGRLGYSGFKITTNWEPGLEPEIFIDSGIVDIARYAVTRVTGPELELWLLETGGANVPAEVIDHVKASIKSPRYQIQRGGSDFGILREP